jgi:hypothetical protein
MSKVNAYLSRASATAQLRRLDYKDPKTWEFSGFSQNGEDGIIDVLVSKLIKPSKFSIEIGANNGVDNCTAWLCIGRRYQSLMIEANRRNAERAKYLLDHLQGYHTILNCMITPENIQILNQYSNMKNLDVFSIDIDSIDYYVAKSFLDLGFKPKIIVAEYNSVFGPENSITVKYDPEFFKKRDSGQIHMYYWGVSLQGWINFLGSYGYKFITTESCGVNAFFIKPSEFDDDFIGELQSGYGFIDNFSTVWHSGTNWEGQFEEVKGLEYVRI